MIFDAQWRRARNETKLLKLRKELSDMVSMSRLAGVSILAPMIKISKQIARLEKKLKDSD